MVLGIRSKSRKRVSIQVHYIIHIQEIKPWPPSQSLKSAQSLLLQWENGDRISGSLPSTAGDGRIEFNESFRLSVLLWRETSKKGEPSKNFQKNCLEFCLYDKTGKSQLLGSATINLADFGIIKETRAISTQLNCKRSFRHSSQPFLYVNIQPFDVEGSTSSPNSSLSKEMSVDKEESESVSQSLNDDDDDDLEIASFTDDDSDESPSNTLQTFGSASKTAGDSIKISKEGTKGSNGEFVLPLEKPSSSLLGNAEGEASTQFNGIKSPSSSAVLSSDMGNAASVRPSLPIFSEESVKVADANPLTLESIQQSYGQNISKGGMVKAVSSDLHISSSMQSNFEKSSQSQVSQVDSMIEEESENSSRNQRYKNGGQKKVSSVSNTEILEDKEKMERGKGREQITMGNKLVKNEQNISKGVMVKAPSSALHISSSMQSNFEGSSQSQVSQEDSMIEEESENSGRNQRYKKGGQKKVSSVSNTESLEDKEKMERGKGREQITMGNTLVKNEQNVSKGVMVKALSSASHISSSMQSNFEGSSQSQVSQEDSMTEEESEDRRRDQRYNKGGQEKVSTVSNTEILEDKEKMERGKGREQITMGNRLVENEPAHNFSEDDSSRKGKSNSPTHLLTKQSHEHPTSILMNDKAEDVRIVKFPLLSAESSGRLSRSHALDQAEDINNLRDVHVDAACHPSVNVNDSLPNTELKAEVEMLREELREAAALEVSLYSIIADHGGSANKVHAPARRLSRFYFHAYRVGSPATRASAAQSAVSGLVLVSKACGNDVPRLTFWFSNLILLRAIVSNGIEKRHLGDSPCINSECDENGSTETTSPKRSPPPHEEEKEDTVKCFQSWVDPATFLVALEKVEAWIFSRIVESVWWQTLTPYMQSAATKSSSSKKMYGRRYGTCDQDQGSFSIDLWKRAFKDACERLCPVRAGRHECGCLPVIARLVMEQLVNRLDVAMFNAILRESAEEIPTSPISDPISDSKVLPIPAGKSGFGAGAQLKNAIGDWSRWLSDLFGIDDGDSHEDSNDNDDNKSPKYETSFKAFHLLNALSDLMMLPFEMLADESMRKEVCPRFGASLIRRVLNNFVPDEFSPGPIPHAVLEALNREDIQDDEGSITSFPCMAGPTLYAPPPAASVMGMLQEVRTQTLLRSGSFVLKKLYTSDDELDDLDSPFSALGMDDSSLASEKKFKLNEVKGGRKVVRYELLREVWKSSE